MNILAIETSCDETALTFLTASGPAENPSFDVRASALHSQIDVHREFGGVFPSLAKREHMKNLPILFDVIMEKVGAQKGHATPSEDTLHIMDRNIDMRHASITNVFPYNNPGIDAIAVTYGPGLEPALWVGISFAQALAHHWHIPIIPVNHMKGHLFSVLHENNTHITWPAIALLVSGGHTELVYAPTWSDPRIIGQTRDDAAGEAFDKVARILGLPYPGGPEISRLAEKSRQAGRPDIYNFPRPMIHSQDFDFSFSGLKTAALYAVQKHSPLSEEHREDFARSFEDAAIDTLVSKLQKAQKEYHAKSIIVAGGVAANAYLEKRIRAYTEERHITLHIPHRSLATDNATMIGMAGYIEYLRDPGIIEKDPSSIVAQGNLSIS